MVIANGRIQEIPDLSSADLTALRYPDYSVSTSFDREFLKR